MAHNVTGITWHLKQYQLLALQAEPVVSFTGSKQGNLCICVEGSWLFVIHNGCVVENINLLTSHKNVNGTRNGNVLMLNQVFSTFNRKFSVTFLDTVAGLGVDHCRACVTHLQKYIKFSGVNEIGQPMLCEMTLPETFTHFMEEQKSKDGSACTALSEARIPDDFPVEDALKLIIADPGFGPLVARVQQVFTSMCSDNTNTVPLQQ